MSDFRPLSAVARIRRGASPRPIGDPRYFGGDVGWVRISDVTKASRFLRATEQYLSPLGETLSVRVRPGDLIMSICGSIGRPILLDMDACIHDGFVQFSELDGVDSTYLFYVLQFSEGAFNAMGQSGTQTNLNTGLAGRHRFYCPHISVQKKIAVVLTSLDTAIEKTEALIEKHQQIKAGLMHDLFTRGVLLNGQLRPHWEQKPALYQETPWGAFPREWSVSKLDDEICIIDCKHVTPSYIDQGYAVVRPRNVKADGLDFSDIEYVSKQSYLDLTSTHVPKAGDIVFSRNASFGVPAYVELGMPAFAVGQDVVIMTRSQADTRFIFYALRSSGLSKQIEVKSGGSTFARINLSDIRTLRIGVPPMGEQLEIARRLLSMDALIAGTKHELEKLGTKKLGLMQDLLTGKVPVKVADPEVVLV